MRDEKIALRLVDLLYSCVDGELLWSAFLDKLAEHFGANLVAFTTASISSAGPNSMEVPKYQVHNVCIGIDASEVVNYEKNYMGINPWFGSGRIFANSRVVLTEEVLSFNVFRKSAFYNEWGKKNGVAHALGAAIGVNPNLALVLAVNRGDSQGPFGEQHRESAQLLVPHLKRAANLQSRMGAFEDRAWVLDELAFPMMYVSSVGVVQWANQAAEILLRKGRGLQLRDGRLHAQFADEDVRLQKIITEERALVARSVDGYGGWLRATSPDGSEVSLFLTRPPNRIRRSLGLLDGSSGFLVFVAKEAIDRHTLTTRVRKIWGLTVAEANLAVELLETEGLKAAAERSQISKNTAKTQLSAIFDKAGVRRQSELVRKLLALAMIGEPSGRATYLALPKRAGNEGGQ